MDAITIENANKIRASMGLAPLPMPSTNGGSGGLSFKTAGAPMSADEEVDTTSTLERREAAAGDNWRKLEDERRALAARQKRKEALKKQRDQEQRNKVLIGKGLADSSSDEDGGNDARSWLLGQKARQKKIAKATTKQEEAAAREAARAKEATYSSRDLAGLKVGHEMDAFDTGAEQILTLKDAEIGEEEVEDELEAAELLEKERTQRNNDLKRGKPAYDPNEIDESGDRTLLKQYDDEDEIRKRKRFKLDASGGGVKTAVSNEADKTAGRVKISLDLLQDDTPISDYAELKIKKPKKSKNKTARRRGGDDDEDARVEASVPTDLQGIDETPLGQMNRIAPDEDEREVELARQRRQALKQRKKTGAAELARQMREEAATADHNMANGHDEEEPGMVLDETLEFVASLKRPGEESDSEAERRAKKRAISNAKSHEPMADADQDGDLSMAQAMDEREPESPAPNTAGPSNIKPVFEDEETLDQGVAASLKLLKKRGVLKDPSDPDLVAKDRARVEFQVQNQALIDEYDTRARLDRERDRRSGRFDRMSAVERDAYQRKQNEQREAYLSTLRNKHYSQHYKPDVKLSYTDEFGRNMTQREAFKHLSHIFHGKGSGKQKVEKKLKKVEDEKRAMAKSVLDAGNEGGMRNAIGQQARKNNTAGVRLQ